MQDNFNLHNWRLRVVNEEYFKEGQGELNVYGYTTKHFDEKDSNIERKQKARAWNTAGRN